MFLTDSDLKQALANVLKVGVATLPTQWLDPSTGLGIVHDSNVEAYMDIRGALMSRGFLASEVDNWDRGPSFQRDIGLYWCLVKGSGLYNYDPTYVKLLDRRKDLESVMVEMGGAPQQPADTPSVIGSGRMHFTREERREIRAAGGQGWELDDFEHGWR